MTQLSLTLESPVDYSADAFLVTDCNRSAWDWLAAWPEQQPEVPFTLLLGPEKSGKTHLLSLWAARQNEALSGPVLDWSALDDALPSRGLFLADGLAVAPSLAVARLNRLFASEGRLLMALPSDPDPRQLYIADFASRLRRAYLVTLDRLDDALLPGLLLKGFADRQLRVDADLIAFLTLRLPRDYAAVWRAVQRLDEAALSAGRRVTIPLARQVLPLNAAEEAE